MSGVTDVLVDAIRELDIARVKAQLQRHAIDLNLVDRSGFTPLYVAAMKKNTEAIKLLLAKGARADAKGDDGETPLYIATLNGGAESATALLSSGANVNEVNGANAETALHCAARIGLTHMVELLCSARAQINARTTKQETPLFQASQHGHTAVVFQLLMLDANRSIINADGKDALYIASERRHKGVVQLLKCEKKYLKNIMSQIEVEQRMAPPNRLLTTDALMSREAKAPGMLARRNTAPAAPETAPTPALPKPAVQAPAASKLQPVEVPQPQVSRTHNPLTGDALPPCKTLAEARATEPDLQYPDEAMKPIDAPVTKGTTMVDAFGNPVVPLIDPLPGGDDVFDFRPKVRTSKMNFF